MASPRRSLADLQKEYNNGNTEPLDKVVKAFAHIQNLKPDDPNSFQVIAGYHGEPFRNDLQPQPPADDWWGGYCFHDCVLFPTWHRAYLLHLEQALQTAPGCEDVRVPFWDECALTQHPTDQTVIPEVLTQQTYTLDGKSIPNPLYSFKLRADLAEAKDQKHSKPEGYKTVRYPLSGLVGTASDQLETTVHNSMYADPDYRVKLLNQNVRNWLVKGRSEDGFPVLSQYQRCLQAPDYTTFSNTESAKARMNSKVEEQDPKYIVPLEKPHNAIHLAVGGFHEPTDGNLTDDELPGANGDMGENNTASFDPIFYFHHCFVDYVFWQWQKRHDATKNFEIDKNDPAAKVPDGGVVNWPANDPLTMETPLEPFVNPKSKEEKLYYTSRDLVDIETLGYTYGPGSLDNVEPPKSGVPSHHLFAVSNINRAHYKGSFVIRTYAMPSRLKIGELPGLVEVGREPILSRWNVDSCGNCQNHLDAGSFISIGQDLIEHLLGDTPLGDLVKQIPFQVGIQNHGELIQFPNDMLGAPGNPILKHLSSW